MVTTYNEIADKVKAIDWKFASENSDDDLHTDVLFMEMSVNYLKNSLGFSYSHGLLIYNGHKGKFYFPREEAKEINRLLIDKLKYNLSFGELLNRNIVIQSIELEKIWEKYISYKDFSSLPLDELFELYNIQLDKHYKLYEYGWVPEILQDSDYGIDNWIVEIFKKYDPCFLNKDILSIFPNKASHTIYFKHEFAFVKIVENIIANEQLKDIFSLPAKSIRTLLPYKINRQIRNLINKYGWIGYHGYDERRPYDFNYYLGRLKQYIESEEEFIALKTRLYSSPPTSDLWSRLSDFEKRLLRIYNSWGASKSRRRLAQLRNFYFLDMLIEELAYRKKIPEDFIRFMTPTEVKDLFLYDKLPLNIEYRSNSCLYYLDRNNHYICANEYVDIGIAKKAHQNEQGVFRGNIACGGYQIGTAYLIERKSDFIAKDISEDAILVTREADPDIFVLFDKIKAIVTDQGGITCHVASLAREYGIPCIVGTRFATEKIRQGDVIEVNASLGYAKILETKNNQI